MSAAKRINISVYEADLVIIDRLAKRAGLSRSAFLVRAALKRPRSEMPDVQS